MKTFLTAIYACVRCILYPGSKVIVASGTKGQSMEVISKIMDLRNDSPNLAREISDLRDGTNDPRVEFHSGSWIRVVAANANARSKRANLLIIDEFRMVDLEVINKVLRKFLTAPRHPKYLSNPKYQHLQERNKEIYLSSCWYKMHWSYQRFMTFVKAMIKGQNYFVCGLPYQLPMSTGLLMREQVVDEMSESDFDPVGWEMEMGCYFWGESEKAFFKFENLAKNRSLFRPIYPKPLYELLRTNNFKQDEKKNGELRILSCDIALMQGAQNDASVYSLYRLIPTKYGYTRYLSSMETLEGITTDKQALRIKQLFYDYDCDYVAIDTNGSGIGVYDQLIMPLSDPDRGVEYEPWTCINDPDMADRCYYPNAEKVIYSIKANSQLNSKIAIKFRDNLVRKKIKLLVQEDEGRESLKSIRGFNRLPLTEQAKFIAPFIQTTAFINETINLENVDDSGDGVRLKEPAGKRKDRYSSASYGDYVANILEKQNFKPGTNYDEDDDLVYF